MEDISSCQLSKEASTPSGPPLCETSQRISQRAYRSVEHWLTGSASARVQSFANVFTKDFSESYVADVKVVTRQIELLRGTVSRAFLDGVEDFPSSYDPDDAVPFTNFINRYGTHYIRKARVGGQTSFESFITRSEKVALQAILSMFKLV